MTEENAPTEPTQYELSNDLPSIQGMTDHAVKREIARVNSDLKNPYWDEDHQFHRQAVDRMSRLFKTGPPAKSGLAQELEKQGIRSEADVDKVVERGFREIEAEKVRRDYEKFRNEMALKFPDIPQDEFGKVVESANTTFHQLQKDGLLAPDFGEFLDETQEGNKPETLKFFSDASKLQARYIEWKEKQKK